MCLVYEQREKSNQIFGVGHLLRVAAPVPGDSFRCNLLGPQSRFGDKRLRIWLVCPPNGTTALKGFVSPPDHAVACYVWLRAMFLSEVLCMCRAAIFIGDDSQSPPFFFSRRRGTSWNSNRFRFLFVKPWKSRLKPSPARPPPRRECGLFFYPF